MKKRQFWMTVKMHKMNNYLFAIDFFYLTNILKPLRKVIGSNKINTAIVTF